MGMSAGDLEDDRSGNQRLFKKPRPLVGVPKPPT